LRDALQALGVHVTMTRDADASVGMTERVTMINTAAPNLMLSVHHNSAANPAATGAETLIRQSTPRPGEMELAERLAAAMAIALGIPNRGVKRHEHGVLRTNTIAVTLELGFINNPREEALLVQHDVQQRVVESVVEVIADVFEIAVEPTGTPILLDGSELRVRGMIVDGVTFAPVRALGEALGLHVQWNAELGRVELRSIKSM